MADREKKTDVKAVLRNIGLAVGVIGLILIIVGVVMLVTVSGADEKVKYGLTFGGIALSVVGTVLIFIGNRKDKAERAPEPVACKYCGELNPFGSKYCRKCGKPMVKRCVNCGVELDMDAQFCNVCGVRVRND